MTKCVSSGYSEQRSACRYISTVNLHSWTSVYYDRCFTVTKGKLDTDSTFALIVSAVESVWTAAEDETCCWFFYLCLQKYEHLLVHHNIATSNRRLEETCCNWRQLFQSCYCWFLSLCHRKVSKWCLLFFVKCKHRLYSMKDLVFVSWNSIKQADGEIMVNTKLLGVLIQSGRFSFCSSRCCFMTHSDTSHWRGRRGKLFLSNVSHYKNMLLNPRWRVNFTTVGAVSHC